jgi:hypothetical protein
MIPVFYKTAFLIECVKNGLNCEFTPQEWGVIKIMNDNFVIDVVGREKSLIINVWVLDDNGENQRNLYSIVITAVELNNPRLAEQALIIAEKIKACAMSNIIET